MPTIAPLVPLSRSCLVMGILSGQAYVVPIIPEESAMIINRNQSTGRTAEVHTAHRDSQNRRHAQLVDKAVLELRSKHDEHDIQGDDNSTSSNNDGTNDECGVVCDIWHGDDGKLSNVV